VNGRFDDVVARESPTFASPHCDQDLVGSRVVVSLRPEAADALPAVMPRKGRARSSYEPVLEPIQAIDRTLGILRAAPAFPLLAGASAATGSGLTGAVRALRLPTRVRSLAGVAVLDIREAEPSPEVLRSLSAAAAVEYVEVMPPRWLAAAPSPTRNMQWGLRAIEWFDAMVPDTSDIDVAVVDSGLDTKHPDLQLRTLGYHRLGLSARDASGHGTHVVGVIASATNDTAGITGMAAPRISVWKVVEDTPRNGKFIVDVQRYTDALGALVGDPPDIVNLSLVGTRRSKIEETLIRLLEAAGVVIVAAMGNEYDLGNPIVYPARYPEAIAVGSLNEARRRSSFSNTGEHIDLLAPGSNILSTLPTYGSRHRRDKSYGAMSGTSMAVPHVAATAAMLRARDGSLTPSDVRTILRKSATPLADRHPGWTSSTGAGLLNVKRAVH
jgi:hypothetical protein